MHIFKRHRRNPVLSLYYRSSSYDIKKPFVQVPFLYYRQTACILLFPDSPCLCIL